MRSVRGSQSSVVHREMLRLLLRPSQPTMVLFLPRMRTADTTQLLNRSILMAINMRHHIMQTMRSAVALPANSENTQQWATASTGGQS